MLGVTTQADPGKAGWTCGDVATIVSVFLDCPFLCRKCWRLSSADCGSPVRKVEWSGDGPNPLTMV